MESGVREGLTSDRATSGQSVDGLKFDQLLEAQYRKTDLRQIYRDTDAADRVSKLMRLIENEVIPRLVSSHSKKVLPRRPELKELDTSCVALFVRILLGDDENVDPASFVADFQAAGIAVETIYLNLLAPAARQVGALWDDDRCTFFDVTLALGTLHRIMLSLSAEAPFEHRKIDPARRVLLVQARGGEHTFGLEMVAEFFKRGAWTVDLAYSTSDEDVSRAVQADWFTVVGFSVACDPSLDTLAGTIRTVRRASSNPAVGILVGGPAFTDHRDNVARVGADGMAADAIHAVLEAERFVLHARSSPS